MKLLINICSHDGIVSYYSGVGTMTIRYIKTISNLLQKFDIDYNLNLFTPEYSSTSFGYNKTIHKENMSRINTKIYQVSNGSNKKVNFGTVNNWKTLCENTAKIINKIDKHNYDKVLTICNDTPFCCLINKLVCSDNHIKVLILHSSIKIHKVDSAVNNNENSYIERLNWELTGINYINKEKNSYLGSICKYFENHLIKEYCLNKKKILNIYNGELLNEKELESYSTESQEIVKDLSGLKSIILAFGRAEEYKNLDVCFDLGYKLNIQPIVIGQLYYKGQPIEKKLKERANQYGGILYIDPPFDLAKCILNTFKGKIICLIPSKEEIMGLIVNEVRKLNKNNILIVANNIGGLKEQIKSGYDGVLVNLNNLDESVKTIKKYFKEVEMKRIANNSQKTLRNKYDFSKTMENFLKDVIIQNKMECEYCYKVKNLDKYIEYIEKNYKFIAKYEEKRVIYRNGNNIARITFKNKNKYLDFKENKINKEPLTIRKESKTIKFNNLKNCEDILCFLNYVKDNSMKRIRSIYQNDQIKFEIDEYIEPEKAYIISFEGDLNECEKVDKELKILNEKYQII